MRTLPPITTALIALALLACRPAAAAELGEPQAELLAKYGQPRRVDAQGLVWYQWDAWVLGVQFVNGVAGRLEYGKAAPLAAADVLGVLYPESGQPTRTKTGHPVSKRSGRRPARLDEDRRPALDSE
jgi:hypothetical protein